MKVIFTVLFCFSNAGFKDALQENSLLALSDLVTRQVNEIWIQKFKKRLKVPELINHSMVGLNNLFQESGKHESVSLSRRRWRLDDKNTKPAVDNVECLCKATPFWHEQFNTLNFKLTIYFDRFWYAAYRMLEHCSKMNQS